MNLTYDWVAFPCKKHIKDMRMIKKNSWGGARPGAGRKPGHKTGKKIVWLGLRWERSELDDVLTAIRHEGIENKSRFVINAAVSAARKIIKHETS